MDPFPPLVTEGRTVRTQETHISAQVPTGINPWRSPSLENPFLALERSLGSEAELGQEGDALVSWEVMLPLSVARLLLSFSWLLSWFLPICSLRGASQQGCGCVCICKGTQRCMGVSWGCVTELVGKAVRVFCMCAPTHVYTCICVCVSTWGASQGRSAPHSSRRILDPHFPSMEIFFLKTPFSFKNIKK